MKKGKITSALFVIALAAGAFTGLTGCADQKLTLNHNTKITALESALAQENYTTTHETTNGNGYKQIVNMYDENFALTIINQNNGGQVTTDKYYSFVNYEGENLMLYMIHQANNVEGVLNAGGQFKIISAEKQLATYGDIARDLGNLDLLTTAEGKLVPKDNTTTLRFANNTISTTTQDGTKITLSNIGTTRIELSGDVLTSATHAPWQDEIVIDGVKYVLKNNAYTAILDDNFWAKHAHANILEKVNTLDVVALQQNGTTLSYAGRTITLPITFGGDLASENGFCFDLINFVNQNGKVEFADQTIAKTLITQNTTIADLTNFVASANFQTTKTTTTIFSETSMTTEKITYQNREYVKETIQLVDGEEYLTTEYGIFVGGIYYKIIFTNYDSAGELYGNNAFVYSYCARSDANLQSNLGEDVLSALTQTNGKLETVNNFAEISFDLGNLTITNLFGNATANFGSEVLTFANVAEKRFDVPAYVIETILQQDSNNPLN